jgi:hypothetical protein
MAANHTPGPWHVAPGRFPAITIEFDGTETHTGCQVCRIEPEDDSSAAVRMAEANARLIAAAPELVAALRTLLEHAGESYVSAPNGESQQWKWQADTARAALAKAGG